MSKMTIALNETTEEDLKKHKLPKQASEILVWMFQTYGVGKAVEQKELFETLDSHLSDNKVLSVTPKQPISRIFQFYRKRLADEGIITIVKEAAAKEEKTEGDTTVKGNKKSRRKDAPVAEEAGAAETSADQL